MLLELHIKNFAIIDELNLRFASGFNVITGETGAGKSILIDAVDFALGGRSEADFIRSGEEKASVDLSFRVPAILHSEVRSLLEANEIQANLSELLVLSREIRANGRSSARINGHAVKVATYSEIGGLLVDIHGQTEHLSLLRPRSHIFLLDRFADLEDAREAVAELVRKLNGVRQTINSIQQNEREREQRIEMLKYQIEEIETARLRVGEEEELREERNRLSNSEKLANLSEEVYEALFGEDAMGRSGLDALNRAAIALEKLAALDPSLHEESVTADTLAAQAEDLAASIRRYREHVEVSPRRLEDVEERLEIVSRLKRRYGDGDSIKKVLEHGERARTELENIEMGEERLTDLHRQEEELLHSIGDLSKKLTNERRRAGKKLSAAIVEQLKDLRMENARFEVSIMQEEDPQGCYVGDERLAFDSSGVDTVEFMMSANIGEPLKPLAKVASGGETARIMLALKSVLSQADRTSTLIFDEIDQGIGGRIGATVGEKLWGLSQAHQVLCVTHLAQIASYADSHFNVVKRVDANRTRTQVTALFNMRERIHELGEMLGGASDASQQNAQNLIETALRYKKDERQPRLMTD